MPVYASDPGDLTFPLFLLGTEAEVEARWNQRCLAMLARGDFRAGLEPEGGDWVRLRDIVGPILMGPSMMCWERMPFNGSHVDVSAGAVVWRPYVVQLFYEHSEWVTEAVDRVFFAGMENFWFTLGLLGWHDGTPRHLGWTQLGSRRGFYRGFLSKAIPWLSVLAAVRPRLFIHCYRSDTGLSPEYWNYVFTRVLIGAGYSVTRSIRDIRDPIELGRMLVRAGVARESDGRFEFAD
jgi:hypothetical protein